MVSQLQGFRLSPQQGRLWRLQRDGHAYRAQLALMLDGELSREALAEALRGLVERHEILRTTFQRRPGMKTPVQIIGEGADFETAEVDLSGAEPEELHARLAEVIDERRSAPFDFARGPLLRTTLIILSPRRHLLLLDLPALCADAPTLGILAHELANRYGAAVSRGELPGEAMQYADIAEWQHELLESEEARRGLDYWRGRDLSALRSAKLPFELKRDGAEEFGPRSITLTLDEGACDRARAVAEEYGTTLADFMLTCWRILLSRLAGGAEVVVGAAANGRGYEELSEAPGPFTKYLPVRVALEDGTRFNEALKAVAATRAEGERWQDCFTWNIFEESSEPGDGPTFAPFCFDFEGRRDAFEGGGVTFTVYEQYACTDRFHLRLSCAEEGGRVTTHFYYDAGLYRAEDVGMLARQFHALAESAADAPESATGRLGMLHDEERLKLVVEFNRTAADFPRHLCLHQLFEAQAARTPQSVALVFKEESVTYAELDARAEGLARRLHAHGVGPESVVGLFVERSTEMVVAVLGVLKAGGAYLPLDPAQPSERLSFMLEDARASVLLTTRQMEESALPSGAHRVVYLDADEDEPAPSCAARATGEAVPENLAYVIYTSGSTGRPKGVMVTHRGAVNYLDWARAAYRVDEGEGAPVHSSIGFDLTVTSLFTPLLAGRKVVLVPESAGLEGLGAALGDGGNFSLVKITPAHLEVLGRSLRGADAAGATRALVVGGEALRGESLLYWKEHAPRTRVVNEYGPTETVVGCCVYELEAGEVGPGVMPIGRPIANTQMYVLDGEGRPVPPGVVGEIHIGGEGVARGYLQRPALTAEKFIPDAFSNEPGRRLYRSGDLGRFRADGLLEYVGRLDSQVKVRGYRVELGEIESVIGEQEGVRETVVLTREDEAGERSLAGYVVWEQGARRTIEELKRDLRERLPEYMIPVSLFELDGLPLTANGKVDRKALAAFVPEARPAARADEAALTPVEEIVAGVWAEVLGHERIGPEDNFFELGGHSLLALRTTARLQSAFQTELPVDAIFESPTVATMAEMIEKSVRAGVAPSLPPIEPAPRDGERPLSYAQQRLWILDRFNPGSAAFNIPFAVRLEGDFDVSAFERTLTEIVRRHEVLRTSFPRVGELPAQVVAPARHFGVTLCDLSGLGEAESEVLRLAAEEAELPFDLGAGPLLRVKVLRLDERRHIVLFTMHHIVSDGWSVDILVRELAALYEAFTTGKSAPLAELPVQYADFADWQRRWMQGETLEALLDYWRRQLAGSPVVIDLRPDRPRTAALSSRGAARSHTLGAELSGAVRGLSRREGVTLFMTLLAAFEVLLYHRTKQEDVLIGTDVAGRTRAEMQGLIGFFVNQLVIRADLSGDPTFRELLRRVRRVALGAYAHQELPFDKLVEDLNPERGSNYSPLFQVKFIFQSAPEETVELPGLVLKPLEVGLTTTKLDLTMSVEDTGRELLASLQYSTDLFEPATVARMLGEFEELLGALTARPDARLSELDETLAEFDRRQQAARAEQYKAARRSLFTNIRQKAARGDDAAAERQDAGVR